MTSVNRKSEIFAGRDRRDTFEWKWNAWSTVLGALLWITVVVGAGLGRMSLGPIECLLLLAPLVTIPLGLRVVLDDQGQGIARRLFRFTLFIQPMGALLAVGGFMLPPSRWAGALAAVWLGVTVCIGLCGLMGMVHSRIPWFERACLNLGLIYLPFGGVWLVASRLGANPADFKEPIVLLTAVHFHYAAFASPLLAGMTGIALRAVTGSRHKLFPLAACSVMAAPALLAAGWALGSPFLKVAAAFMLAAGLLGVVALTFLVIPHFRNSMAGALLVISGMSIVAGMCLVCVYSGGEYVGAKFITIPQMAVSHGILNSLGFTLCGLLAWRVEQSRISKWSGKETVKGDHQ
jgi:hypothetical protein